MKKSLIILFTTFLTQGISAQDPNFHIYLCFGQSNMEGQGKIETKDYKTSKRFKVFQSLDCPDLGRKKQKWYKATPPLCQCGSGLSPADYFGRTLVDSLPDSIRIGVMNVAVGGCDIRLFDKELYVDYDSTFKEYWFTEKIKSYNGNPYQHLMTLAKAAQQDGVIKGFLVHQGETNTGDEKWPDYVNKIYNDMLTELSLKAEETPILVGEVVHADQNGKCAAMNPIINTLPQTIPNGHVVSSSGCTPQEDDVHFNSEGYRELGRRYALKLLEIMYR